MSSHRRSSRSESSSSESLRAGARIERLNHVLFEELTALVQDELRDPLFADVELGAFELSVDARMARVHYFVRGPDIPGRREEVDRAFTRAAPFLRSRLAALVDL